jgi:Uma2 family endonuclease
VPASRRRPREGEAATRPITADGFLAWDDGTNRRYELIDGQIVAMAPPSDPHGTIVVNAAIEVGRWLEGRAPCRAIVEAGTRLDERNHRKADVAVTAPSRGRRPTSRNRR